MNKPQVTIGFKLNRKPPAERGGAVWTALEKTSGERVYRFHCLGGGDAVFDGTGRRMENLAQVRAEADRVALALMEMAETD